MFSNLSVNLDQLLHLAATISVVVFVIVTVLLFLRWLFKYGFSSALIRLISYRVLVPLLLVIGINLLSLAFVFIEPTHVGVIISLVSPGGVRPRPFPAGLHWLIPLLEEVELYPIYWQTYTMSGKPEEGQKLGNDSIRARTSDGQEVHLDTSIIFRVNPNQVVLLHIDWQDRYAQDFVRPVVRGYVRTEVSQFTVDEVNSAKRKDLEAALDRLLKAEIAEKGLILDQFLLRDITFSEEYGAAIEQKQIALEGKQQTEYEAQQIINLAQGDAQAIEIEAEAQSKALRLIGQSLKEHPDLVTYHYVEKLSPNIRAMLIPSGNPLVLSLPSKLTDAMLQVGEDGQSQQTSGAEAQPQ